MYCYYHDLEVTGSNPCWVKLLEHNSNRLYSSLTKNSNKRTKWFSKRPMKGQGGGGGGGEGERALFRMYHSGSIDNKK